MKKYILILTVIAASYTSFAGTGLAPEPKPNNKQWLFKPLASNDVSLEVERLDGNVLMYLFSQNMRNVDMIYVERSNDPTNNFTRCKTVKVAEHLIKSKNYINVVDDAPLNAGNDSYYRIRTVTAAGATKIYPVISLAPIVSLEPETVDNSK